MVGLEQSNEWKNKSIFTTLFPVVEVQEPEDDGESDVLRVIPVAVSDAPECSVRAALIDVNPFGRVPQYVS